MSLHQKELTKKQKIIIYISSFAIAIVVAIVAVILLVHTVKNPPAVIFNSGSTSYTSAFNFSNFENSSEIYIPEATVTVTPEGTDEKVEEIIETVDQIEATSKNTVIVKNYTVDTSALTKKQVKLDVKYLSQNPELPTGCEITSLTTVLNYYGYNVSKTEMSDNYLEKTMDTIGNFWEVFVGNPRKNGFGCYAKPIAKAANRYLSEQDDKYKAVDYSGAKFEELLKIVENGTPVIIWGTAYGEKENDLRQPFATVKWNIDGQDLQWIAPEHCMVLIGYDIDRHVAIMSDPQRGIVEYNLETVKARYLAMHSQCVILEAKPVINGVENGMIYYTTQYVTIVSKNLASVTVNGEESETSFFINGNKYAMYVIEVTDTFDNTITYTIYTKKIEDLSQGLEGLNSYSVTTDNKSIISNTKNKVLQISTKYSPTKECEALDEITILCDNLLNKIDEVEKEIKYVTETFEIYKNKEITVNDVNAITALIEDTNKLLSSENLTTTQRSELKNLVLECNKWLIGISPSKPNIHDDKNQT